jgi:hypothetical protein
MNYWSELTLGDTDDLYRLQMKQQAIDDRVAAFGHCLCDLCRERQGVEYHEIVNRGRTVASEEARLLSFAPEICSLLCDPCHKNIASTNSGRERLFRFNIALYGYFKVYSAFIAIPPHYRPNIRMPDY